MSEELVRTLIEIQPLADPERFRIAPDLSNAAVRAEIQSALRGSALTLVAGAGVSVDSRMPDWPSLVSKAAELCLAETPVAEAARVLNTVDLSLPAKIRFIETTIGLRV